jgi:hypothetical protein
MLIYNDRRPLYRFDSRPSADMLLHIAMIVENGNGSNTTGRYKAADR